MKIKKHDGLLDKRVATAAIVSDTFLAGIRHLFRPEYVDGELLETVLGWCCRYYDEHSQAPGRSIQEVFAFERDRLDPDLADDIARFLAKLSKEYEEEETLNAGYLLEQFSKKLRLAALRHMADQVRIAVDDDDLDEASRIVAAPAVATATTAREVEPFSDPEAVERAFLHQAQPLFTFPGALGRMLNEQLTPDSLVGLLGREKIGKTWMLMEFAMRALRAGQGVAFFQAGDLSMEQQVLRFNIRLAGASNRPEYCGKVLVPCLDCVHNQNDTCEMRQRAADFGVVEMVDDKPVRLPYEEADGYVPCTFCKKRPNKRAKWQGASWWSEKRVKQLTPTRASKIGARFSRGTSGKLRVASYSPNTMTTRDIMADLKKWQDRDGFVPSVVVVDYADIMAADDPRKDKRHQENERWINFRAISEDWHCCFVVATQADAASYKKKLLTLDNFSEDKRKYAHVTAMYGLNQTPEEKRWGQLRINQMLVREGAYDSAKCVTVLQSLETGRPVVDSF